MKHILLDSVLIRALSLFHPVLHRPLTNRRLARQHQHYRGNGGCSQNNAGHGFIPAFRDTATGRSYASRFADGRPAPVHVLAGLPPELVLRRDADGIVTAAKATVVAGFLRGGVFFTREQAAAFTERQHGTADTALEPRKKR